MIRKFTHILLIILILFSNSGWAFSFHYCKDELASISFTYEIISEQENDSCDLVGGCCESNDEHSNCCDNQTFESSKSDDTLSSKTFQLSFFTFALPENSYNFKNISILKSNRNVPAFYVDLNAPPLYKLFCQLIFYA
ncbi:HYC_CC_PP family protein [Capnocytophaga cynodegmi]|uniref:HYC_CC_PP family protein n=1 Tax=Capnocytophaga cynodegmi TaxID=28189 RepID=UPI00385A33CA